MCQATFWEREDRIIELLLEHKSDPNYLNGRPLYYIVQYLHLNRLPKMLKLFLKYNADFSIMIPKNIVGDISDSKDNGKRVKFLSLADIAKDRWESEKKILNERYRFLKSNKFVKELKQLNSQWKNVLSIISDAIILKKKNK